MNVFDELIGNTDRNLGNELLTTQDWKLHLIDHTRAFRLLEDLSEIFAARPVRLPQELLPGLEALDAKGLLELFDGVLSERHVKSLLARRDKILEKITSDRKTYTDAYVFVTVPHTDTTPKESTRELEHAVVDD